MPQTAVVYVLTLKTAMSGQTVERLLTGVCVFGYELGFDGVEQTNKGERKVMRITFKSSNDRERFRGELRKLATTSPNQDR